MTTVSGCVCGWRSKMCGIFSFALLFRLLYASVLLFRLLNARALLSSRGSRSTGCVVGGQMCARQSSQTTRLDESTPFSCLRASSVDKTMHRAVPPCQSIPTHMCFDDIKKSPSQEKWTSAKLLLNLSAERKFHMLFSFTRFIWVQ